MPDSMRQISLPSELCQAAEQRFGTRFGGLEQFLTFVLQELLRDVAAQMDRAEQRIIEERLRDLGYI
jgi:hypothetical protein